jgi:hypothetical protein
VIAAVRFRPGELPSDAGALFDYLLTHPEARRLLGWRRLEQPASVPRLAREFVAELRASGELGSETIGPVDLAILVIGLANAWDLTGPDLVAAAGGDPVDPTRIAGPGGAGEPVLAPPRARVRRSRRVPGDPRARVTSARPAGGPAGEGISTRG